MSKANIRMELKPGTRCDDRSMKLMIQDFRRKVDDAGIAREFGEGEKKEKGDH